MVDPISLNLNQQGRSKKKKTAIIVVIVVIVAVLIGGFFMLRQSKKMDQTKTTVVENKEPSPTEKPKIDKNSVKIQVLNGTGTPGQAGIAVEALKKAGYNPDNIKADNAKEFNNTVTTITVRDGFDDIASDAKDALKTVFDKINIDPSKLDEKSEFDIVVVTGGKKFEEVTPTTTVTPTENPTPSLTDTTTTPTPTLTSIPTPTSTLTPTP